MAKSKLKPLDVYRQSTLAGLTTCARRTRFALEAGDDITTGWVESTGDLGTVFHAVVAEMLRTMWKYDHHLMPTEEAMVICREVYANGDITLPAEDRRTLAGLTLAFCKFPFNPKRIHVVEARLTLDVVCLDGRTRTLKGQPDVIMGDPPHGLIVVDWKTGQGKPPRPKDPSKLIKHEDTDTELAIGEEYLSDRGHFQLDTYGLLAMEGRLDDGSRIVENAEYVTLREIHLRSGEERMATLDRNAAIEHVMPHLAADMQRLDRGIAEGPKSKVWAPRPGKHCVKQCPVARSCPVPREMRGDGAIQTQHQADVAARAWAVARAQVEQARRQSVAWTEAGHPPGKANEREELRWGPEADMWMRKGGGRGFKLWPVESNGNGDAGC
jgi:RecB family exonuclease